MTRLVSALAAAAALFAAGSAGASVLYSNDFEGGSTADFSAGGIQSSVNPIDGDGNYEHFLGYLAGGSSTDLTVNNGGATSVTLSFDLYGLNSLDGDGSDFCCGPDYFTLLGDSAELLHATFSNVVSWRQSYPAANSPGQTGAINIGRLGYSFYGPDSTYQLSYTISTSGPTTTFRFIGASDQGWGDEGFGIDNVVVTGSGTPEPAAWALMLLGFGGIGAALRNRRRTLATAA